MPRQKKNRPIRNMAMRLSLENSRVIIVWLLLAVIMTGAALHRVNRYKDRPFYNPRTEIGFFYTEEAFQYRHARMIAHNEAVPLYDKKAQWPEGMTPFRDLTLFQEYLHGMAFRLFSFFPNHAPLHVFLIYFVSWFSTLAVLALFLGARALGADEWTALLCSLLYAFTGAAFARLRFYELESTAFPLMALAFATFLQALRGRRYAMIMAAVSGCLLAAALISWHFTRFYLLVFWVSMGGAFLFAGGNRRQAAASFVILLSAAAAGVLSPVMRNSDFLVSPAMLAGAVVMAGLYCDGKYSLGFLSRLALLLAGAVMIVLVLSAGAETAAYGHVWDLLKYKIFHLLIKPADPSALPFAGRILWNGPFNTLSPYLLIYRYGLLLPLALTAAVRLIRQERHSISFEDTLVIFPAVLFLAANLMVQRLTIFGAFFLGLVVVYLFAPLRDKDLNTAAGQPSVRSFLNGSRLFWIFLGVCLVFQVREAVLCDNTVFSRTVWRLFPDHSRSRSVPYTGDQINLLAWIRENTSEDAVFLSHQGNSPSILTYAGRAINLHPKLETQGLREKYRAMLMTLF